MKRWIVALLGIALLVPVIAIALQFWREPGAGMNSVPVADAAGLVARGAYLARAGNCSACHTARGGEPNAGGRAIRTPLGTVHASNITPDPETGIGRWTADDFWRALHWGKSRDGRLLYPAFPYDSYTRVTRADADALFAYLRTVPAVRRENQAHDLGFPYNQQVVLAAWRALYFRPGVFEPMPRRSAEWNRGAYLVQGLGHCSACHAPRNRFGATLGAETLAGGVMPGADWYAPPLQPTGGATTQDAMRAMNTLLKTGVSERDAVLGPMSEVVGHSLQHLADADIASMTRYLATLPSRPVDESERAEPEDVQRSVLKLGGALYEKHCVDCHGADGQGRPYAYPALAGNASMTEAGSLNAIRMILNGGYPPSTGGNPQPYGMPPFGPLLSDADVAALVSFIGTAWGNRGQVIGPVEVGRHRGVPVD